MRISDWGSVVCSSDLQRHRDLAERRCRQCAQQQNPECAMNAVELPVSFDDVRRAANVVDGQLVRTPCTHSRVLSKIRSEEHTSELQSLMRISYAVFCLKKKK